MTKRINIIIVLVVFAAIFIVFFSTNKNNVQTGLITNPNFERRADWENWGGFSYTSASGQVYEGKYSAVVSQAEGGAGSKIISGIEPGQTYTLSGYGKVNKIGQVGILGVDCLDSEGNKIKDGKFIVAFSKTSFEKQSVSFTTVSGTAQLSVYLYVVELLEGGEVYFDNLSLVLEDYILKPQINNGAFLPQDWFNTVQAPDDIADYVKELKEQRIRYQFADIGVLYDDGTLEPKNYAGLGHWIYHSRQIDAEQEIILVVNYNQRVLLNDFGDEASRNPLFGTKRFNQNLNDIVDLLLNKGVLYENEYYKADGIHIDFEPFIPDDKLLLNTLAYLRKNALKENNHFSIAAPINYSDLKNWDASFIKQVASVVNQINPMLYDLMGWDSPIDNPQVYQELICSEIMRYSEAIGDIGPNGQPARLMPWVPAYERRFIEETLVIYHDPYIENIYGAVQGINKAIVDGANVYGAGIFWWPSFMGHYPSLYPKSYYLVDQSSWRKYWVIE
ncbi:carbohydrate binding domain-containing protein [Geosporobacter ferrireducens]|uniref:carbohydrate binding domain-containing protein n=1 Tax=Geosporobacter ferrireducens TaxID=1424294 RepID=UPI00139E6C43|nr:glycosyl hydrolase family 18 protein [Geosporobacter ferrireducens]MTI55604.1 hypothetical protein [Geosporobacter ferrireducens]